MPYLQGLTFRGLCIERATPHSRLSVDSCYWVRTSSSSLRFSKDITLTLVCNYGTLILGAVLKKLLRHKHLKDRKVRNFLRKIYLLKKINGFYFLR